MGAIRGGHYAVVELLLWRGADISQAEETSSTVSILLHSPSLCGRKYFPYVPFQGENDDQNLKKICLLVDRTRQVQCILNEL